LYVIHRLHLEITSDRAAYLDLNYIICGKVKRRVKVTHPILIQNFQFTRSSIDLAKIRMIFIPKVYLLDAKEKTHIYAIDDIKKKIDKNIIYWFLKFVLIFIVYFYLA